MSTFFSGTDTSTLQSEGADTPHFVSLIVNNNGPYCAKITRRVTERIVGTIESEYPTFDDKKVSVKGDCEKATTTHLEAFKLNIHIEGEENDALRDEIEARYKEILASKRAATTYPNYGYYGAFKKEDNPPKVVTPTFPLPSKEKEVKKEEKKEVEEHTVGYIDTYGTPHIPDNLLKALTGQILYGSITMSAESYDKLNKKEWITNNMKRCFERRFGTGEMGLKDYEDWATNHIDVILTSIKEPTLESLGYDSFEITSIAAVDIINAIKELTEGKEYKFVSSILAILDDYVILFEEGDVDTPSYPPVVPKQGNLFNQMSDTDDFD